MHMFTNHFHMNVHRKQKLKNLSKLKLESCHIFKNEILLSKLKKRTLHSISWMNLKTVYWAKESRYKRVHVLAPSVRGSMERKSEQWLPGTRGRRVDYTWLWKKSSMMETFCLGWGDGYMNIYTCQFIELYS
jgi:hypothetical protein